MDLGRRLMGLVESGKMPKPLTKLLNLSRKYSLWVYQWGLACCAIEMGAAFGSPRYDVMRLGVIPLPASPRQADLVVVSGTVTDKMAPPIAPPLRADARPEVRDLDGLVRQLRRPVLGQLLGHQGRRPDHPRRRLRARLPAPARGAARGHRAAAGAHPATRTWPSAGGVSRLSSADDRRTDAAEAAETERRGRGAARRAARGAARHAHRPSSATPSSARTSARRRPVGPGRPREAWADAPARSPSDQLGCTTSTSCRPSTGCRRRSAATMDSRGSTPSSTGTDAKAPDADGAPATPAATPASRCSPASTTVDRALRRHAQGRPARRRPVDRHAGSRSTPAPTGTSARPGRCSASTSSATPTSRNLYLPGDFEGNPLRKDFPLLARVVKPWPGIVDVEPMPGETDEGDAEAAAEGGDAA